MIMFVQLRSHRQDNTLLLTCPCTWYLAAAPLGSLPVKKVLQGKNNGHFASEATQKVGNFPPVAQPKKVWLTMEKASHPLLHSEHLWSEELENYLQMRKKFLAAHTFIIHTEFVLLLGNVSS